MPIERTLVIIKPDAVQRMLEYKILDIFRQKGYTIPEIYQTSASIGKLGEHYSEVLSKLDPLVADSILKYMTSGPIMVAIVQGNNSIEDVRKICGENSEPIKCNLGTIRNMFSSDSLDDAREENRCLLNIIHSSDSMKSAKKEINLWFGDKKDIADTSDDYSKIAQMLGSNTQGDIIELIRKSNAGQILYHGRKRGQIEDTGVSPVSPQGGFCSFWASGKSLFLPSEDSPLFNYSGGKDHNGVIELNLFMADYAVFEEHILLPEFKEDSVLQIYFHIPKDLVAICTSRVSFPENMAYSRNIRQEAERLLLKAVESQLYNGLSLGKRVCYSKQL